MFRFELLVFWIFYGRELEILRIVFVYLFILEMRVSLDSGVFKGLDIFLRCD